MFQDKGKASRGWIIASIKETPAKPIPQAKKKSFHSEKILGVLKKCRLQWLVVIEKGNVSGQRQWAHLCTLQLMCCSHLYEQTELLLAQPQNSQKQTKVAFMFQ